MHDKWLPVYFDGPEKVVMEQRRLNDKEQFYRGKGEAWRNCWPEDYRVVEGEIVKRQRSDG